MSRAVVLLCSTLAVACGQPETSITVPARVQLRSCEPPLSSNFRCGTYEVWENRSAAAGRRIPLNIVVVPASGQSRRSDPVFYFAGGPGAGAADSAAAITGLLRQVNQSRDLVFVDVRGTGRSAPLPCDLPPDDAPLQRFFDDFLDDDSVRACLARQQADVRFYTQPIAMDDIDEVRQALGYERINLFGSSGGTRQEQIYIRRHGGSVRSAVMHGVAPMDAELPLAFSRALDEGVRWLVDACAAAPRCRAAYPALREDWERSTRRFDAGPVEATVRHPGTGREGRIRMSKGVYADGVRHMLYNLDNAQRLAERIHAAGQGNYDAFAQAELGQVIRFHRVLAHGFFIASTCAEDVQFIDEEDIRRATAGTFLGDYRVRRQQAACRIWPKGEGIDADFQQPVRSDLPVLLISGAADVATPAADADRVARTLPNARHVVFPNQGHSYANPACASRLIADFFEAGSVKGLETSCVAQTRTPF